MKGVALFLLAVLVVAQLMVGPCESVSCSQVNNALALCDFYMNAAGTRAPANECCAGVKSLNSMAGNKRDRQAECKCLKQWVARYPTINDNVASSLPYKCDVVLGVPLSRNADCSSIS